MFRATCYWYALILSDCVTFLAFGILVLIFTLDLFQQVQDYPNPLLPNLPPLQTPYALEPSQLKELIPFGTLFLTSLTIFVAILLGWRLDRRQTKKLNLKTKNLELKIKELELKLASSQVSNTQPLTQQFPNF